MSQRSEGHSPQSGLRTQIVICLLLALAVWVVFGQTVHHEFVNYDDNRLVYENPAITAGLSLKGIVGAFIHINAQEWYPLTSLSHMLDCQLYGLNAGGHHLTNVLLHSATAIILFLVLQTMTGALWPSAFVAAVFAIHPLRVESVAWVTERKDVLSGLFFVLTLGAYVRYVRRLERSRPEAAEHHSAFDLRALTSTDYWLTLLLFVLGLLSKTMLVTVPLVLLLLDYWPLGRFQRSIFNWQNVTRLVCEKLPFLLLAAAAGVATILAQADSIQSVQKLGLPSRMGNALLVYATYLGQMFYPVGLAVLYPHPGNQLSVWWMGLSLVLLSIISVGVVRWQRTRPYLLMGWLWYLGMLVPVIGILQVGLQARADRYTYLPQIGLYVLLAWGGMDLCGLWRYGRAVLRAVATVVLGVLTIFAHVQTSYWRDSVSLWTHTLACTPRNFIAHSNLGNALTVLGRTDEALVHYKQAIELQPDSAEANNNLGSEFVKQGKLDVAMTYLQRALQLKPDYAAAYCNLGVALAAQGKREQAIQYYERAVQLKPDLAEAHYKLGIAFAEQGNLEEARQHYVRAVQLKPDDAQVHNSFSVTLTKLGKLEEAIEHCQVALHLKPEDANAHNNLGVALVAQWRLDEAIQQYERALQLKPDFAEAHDNLGIALAAQGKWNEVIQHWQLALQLKPNNANAQNNLGVALARQGRIEEAIPHFEQARQLKPDLPDAHSNLGIALVGQGRIEEAIPCFLRALELKPGLAEVHYHLGIALEKQGKLSQAAEHFEQALNLALAQGKLALVETVRHRLASYPASTPASSTP